MTPSRAGQGSTSPPSTASKKKKEKKLNSANKDNTHQSGVNKDNNSHDSVQNQNGSDADVSFDIPSETWKRALDEIKLSYESKIDVLMGVVESQNKQISDLSEKVGKLTSDINHLKDGYNFLSNDASETKEKSKSDILNATKNIEFLNSKTQDLEDRSRRCNLVFFGVPESDDPREENCDKMICDILKNYQIINRNEAHEGLLERAHRLGRIKPEQTQPRPIIVCCGSFKDKEYILYNAYKLKGSKLIITEDFSRATLDIRRQLVNKGKEAKNKHPEVQSFQIKYRRLILKYQNPTTNKTFTWGFGIKDTQGSANWFEPPNRRSTNSNQNQSMNYTTYRPGYQNSA